MSVKFDGSHLMLALELIASIPKVALRNPVGSLAAYRDDIIGGLDWIFTGI